jgi:hypothetical protein
VQKDFDEIFVPEVLVCPTIPWETFSCPLTLEFHCLPLKRDEQLDLSFFLSILHLSVLGWELLHLLRYMASFFPHTRFSLSLSLLLC